MRNHGRYLLAAPDGALATLDARESRHLLVVRRAEPGDGVELFDGRGRAWEAELVSAEGGRAVCRLRRELLAAPGRRWRLTLAVAVPRGKRMSWLVEKCAELGVEELWPVQWRRSPRGGSENALARWRRLAEAAAKQSRRAALMGVAESRAAAALAVHLAEFDRVLAFDPAGEPPRGALSDLAAGARLLALVGPEGGLAPEDLAGLGAVRRVTLGDGVLRVETAAAAVAALVLAEGLSSE